MSKTKDKTKHRKKETLKKKRQAKEGKNHRHQVLANGESGQDHYANLEAEVAALRNELANNELSFTEIINVTEGVRWKEAKEANRLAREAVSAV